MDNNRNIVDLISKLNDRNLQRRRESGVTVYALLTLLLYIIIKVIESTPSLLAEYRIANLAEFALGTCSIYFGVYLIVGIYRITLGQESPIKLIRREFNSSEILENINILLLAFVPIGLATISIFQFQNWFLYSMLGLFVFFALAGIRVMIGISKKEKSYELVKVENSGKPISIKSPNVIVGLFFALISISLPIAYFLGNQLSFRTESFPSIIKTSLFIYSIPIVIDIILQMMKIKYRDNLLEELEKDIYMNNLSNEQVHKILMEKYMGLGFRKWLKNQQLILKDFSSSLNKRLEEARIFHEEISSIDPNKYPREVQGRRKELNQKLGDIKKSIAKKTQKIDTDIDNINDEVGGQLSFTEGHEFYLFVERVQKDFGELNLEIDELIKTINSPNSNSS